MNDCPRPMRGHNVGARRPGASERAPAGTQFCRVVTAIANVVEHHLVEMRFALCFDGHSLKAVADAKTAEDPQRYAERSLQLAQREFFAKKRYLTHNGQPVLLVFGWPDDKPVSKVDWSAARKNLTLKPLLLSQDKQSEWADGTFLWPSPSKTGEINHTKPWSEVEREHSKFYSTPRRNKGDITMGVAFPGFRDVYCDDNCPDEHMEVIERDGGGTYRKTLRIALSHEHVQYVQIATWNDWNEGTHIEPSVCFGNRELRATHEILNEPGSL